ncbi:MAG: polysaccharide biosynthesis protein [Candidatus Lokiarchaeia archaeon]
MDILNDKIILITGGSGTIGESLVMHILKNHSPKIIRIFSRDETKQSYLARKLEKYDKQLRFFIGDIRDKERLYRAIEDVDIVFHLAALKHVVACEYNPFEAIKTNVLGLQNLIETCIDKNVEKVIFTSTDKAATPCNTMGVTKLLGEKLITASNYYKGRKKTIFYSVRFGNVLGSRGSLIPLIKNQINNNLSITITHSDMTRYIMVTETAIRLILKTLEIAQGGEVFVLKMDAIKIIDLIEVLIDFFAKKNNKIQEKIQIKEIGMFAGEKLYEELFSIEEAERSYEINDLYIIFPQLTEVYKKIDLSEYPNIKKFDKSKPFNSKNGPFLSKKEIKEFLIKNNIIK